MVALVLLRQGGVGVCSVYQHLSGMCRVLVSVGCVSAYHPVASVGVQAQAQGHYVQLLLC